MGIPVRVFADPQTFARVCKITCRNKNLDTVIPARVCAVMLGHPQGCVIIHAGIRGVIRGYP
jgi:hypothetical protein